MWPQGGSSVCTHCWGSADASLRIFENMHKDQLEEIVTLECHSALSFLGKSESFPEYLDKELDPHVVLM